MIRIAAWECVRANADAPLREVDAMARAYELDDRDRGLLRAIVGTEVRRRGTLRALVAHYTRGKPNPGMRAHMRLGLAQVLFLDRVPDHAAVSETVDAVARTLGQSKTRYANAVLRAAIRARRVGPIDDPRRQLVGRDLHLDEPVFRDPSEHPLLWAEDALSVPAHLLKRWEKRHGRERAFDLARLALDEPDLSIRTAAGQDRDALRAELAAAEVETREPRAGGHPRILLAPAAATEAVVATAAFREGRASVQGESALRAAELLGARAGERVLDLCAAPGGKTAVLAENGASVVAVDDDARRLERLRETLERMGVAEQVEVLCGDGTAPLPAIDAPEGAGTFDGVLVDAPCSNTGVLGARPGARWRLGPASLASLTALQSRLLAEAAERVRPGGRLVWSTCSLEPEENGQRVRRFLREGGEQAGWVLAEEHESLPSVDGPTDGGYAALLRRSPGEA